MNYLLWVILPNMNTLCCGFGIVGLIILGVFYGITFMEAHINNNEINEALNLKFKKAAIFLGILLTLGCLTPDKEQLQSLVLIDTISHVKNIKELPDNTVELLNVFIKNQIVQIEKKS